MIIIAFHQVQVKECVSVIFMKFVTQIDIKKLFFKRNENNNVYSTW